jgi:cytoskeletal protein RodZ
LKPRRWRGSITVGVILSLLIGLGAVGLGLWDLHKINKVNGQITASVDNSVASTSIATPTSGQTISGVVGLVAIPIGSHIKAVQFVATGGSSHNVLVAQGKLSLVGYVGNWNTTKLPNGNYQITSIGYNTSGRASRSPAVPVQIKNP